MVSTHNDHFPDRPEVKMQGLNILPASRHLTESVQSLGGVILTALSVYPTARFGFIYLRWFVATLAVCLLLLPASLGVHAQELSGAVGTITDSTGAVVASANVTATNIATGVASHTATTSEGTYLLADLIPGIYSIRIGKQGFETQVVIGVIVEPGGEKASVDAVLKVGKADEVLVVTAPLIALETEEPELGTTVDHALIEELPIEIGNNSGGVTNRGRRIDSFIFLTPGVTGDTFSHRINGGVDFQSEVTFNGLPLVKDETPGFQETINPPYEMVDEARVNSSVFSPQYGLGQGVAAYQFASGTDDLHGSAFEIMRNSYFDAPGAYPNLDANGDKITPVDHEHNFGFSLGGPVLIPKMYNGINKTFFHIDFEWYRLNIGSTQLGTVPTDAMRKGDFSNDFFFNSLPSGQVVPQQIPIYVPLAWASNPSLIPPGCNLAAHGYVPGQQFPGNKIDPGCLSPISQSILAFIPHANNPRTPNPNQNNIFTGISSFPTREFKPGFSIDHNLTNAQKLHGSFWRAPNKDFPAGFYFPIDNPLTQLVYLDTNATGIVLNYSNAIRSNLAMTVGAFYDEDDNGGSPVPAVLKAGAFSSVIANGSATPEFTFGSNGSPQNALTPFGSGLIDGRFFQNGKGFSGANNWIYTRGRHSLNFGMEFRHSTQHISGENCNCTGSLSFNSETTSNNDPNTGDLLNANTTGSAFASFLLGNVDTAFRSETALVKLRNFAIAPYLQDNIKLTAHLTLDAGLRWDIMVPFTSVGSGPAAQVSFFNPNAPNPGAIGTITGRPLDGAMSLLGTCPDCVGYGRAKIHWHNFGPRLGIAYQLNKKTILLSGYALTFLNGGPYDYGDTKIGNTYTGLLAGSLSSSYKDSGYPGPGVGQWDTSSSFPLPSPRPTPFSPALCNGLSNHQCVSFFSRDPGKYPYSESWNAEIQRELPWNLLFSVAYVGNKGIHLPSGLQPFNQLDPNYLGLCTTNGGANNCVLGDSWTCTTQTVDGNGNPTFPCPAPVPAQTILKQLGYGNGSDGFNSAYQNFSNDYGQSVSLMSALVPYPQYPGIITNSFETYGVSFYNALQAQGQMRFSDGIGFLINYALSRAMANTESGFGAFAAQPLNKYNLAPEYTIASYDQTHVVNISSVYELPIGPGKAFLNRGGHVEENLAGGWQVSGIIRYQSGTPFGVWANGNPLNNGFNRANIVPGIKPVISWKNVNKSDASGNPLPVLTPNAFSDPGAWVPGNSPRELESLRTPFSYNENIALAKKFFLGDLVHAELRMEFFNILNRVNRGCGPFSTPALDNNISDGSFGLAPQQCQVNSPRQGQAFFRMSF